MMQKGNTCISYGETTWFTTTNIHKKPLNIEGLKNDSHGVRNSCYQSITNVIKLTIKQGGVFTQF